MSIIPNIRIKDANGDPIDTEIEYVISKEAVVRDIDHILPQLQDTYMEAASLSILNRYKVRESGMYPSRLNGVEGSFLIDLSRPDKPRCRLRSTLLKPARSFTITLNENQQLTRSFN